MKHKGETRQDVLSGQRTTRRALLGGGGMKPTSDRAGRSDRWAARSEGAWKWCWELRFYSPGKQEP